MHSARDLVSLPSFEFPPSSVACYGKISLFRAGLYVVSKLVAPYAESVIPSAEQVVRSAQLLTTAPFTSFKHQERPSNEHLFKKAD